MDAEQWRPVFGYEGIYEVSTLGNVRSVPRIDACNRPKLGHVLKPSLNGAHYLFVNLHRARKQSPITIHRLVAAAFLGPKSDGQAINHRDGRKQNNRADNLEYVTGSRNQRHAVETGLMKPPHYIGSQHPRAILNEAQVRYIRSSAESASDLAARFGLRATSIQNIRQYRTWKHLAG